MSKRPFNESHVPENIRLRVVHLHAGNTSRSKRKGHDMVTIAQLISPTGVIINEARAYCSRKEHSPSRRVGREVAVGRVVKQYYEDLEDLMATC